MKRFEGQNSLKISDKTFGKNVEDDETEKY
jgi:hypothetical protein